MKYEKRHAERTPDLKKLVPTLSQPGSDQVRKGPGADENTAEMWRLSAVREQTFVYRLRSRRFIPC